MYVLLAWQLRLKSVRSWLETLLNQGRISNNSTVWEDADGSFCVKSVNGRDPVAADKMADRGTVAEWVK